MADPVHVLGFAGSLRRASTNRGLLRHAAEHAPDGVTVEIFDLKPIPPYDGDVESQGFPEPVQRFHERLRAADALLIACPEYNYGITGVLKNAIDWASRPPGDMPISGKPLAIMGASAGGFGTSRAQNQLRQVSLGVNMLPLSRPQLMVSRNREKFDADGNLTDADTQRKVVDLLLALRDWTHRLNGRTSQ